MHVRVIVGPVLDADLGLIEEIVTAEFTALGISGELVVTSDADGLSDAVREASEDDTCAVVVVPGTWPVGTQLETKVVWLDLTQADPEATRAGVDARPGISTAELRSHLYVYGRGLWGLTWAVRHAVHRLRSPARRIWYGPHADQWGDLRLPTAARPVHQRQPGPRARKGFPVAVLLHGGYWRSHWGADLMDALAVDLVARGFATWNLEYRRPDRHGWAATTADVASGLALITNPERSTGGNVIDLEDVIVIGHSAGGQLALRLAADAGPAVVRLAVSLAGVTDLSEGARRGLGNGAITAALSGQADQLPGSDPMARLPIGVPLLIVQGRQDDVDLIDINRRFVRAGRLAGDEVVHVEQPGDHFAVIDPASPLWHATIEQIGRRSREQRR